MHAVAFGAVSIVCQDLYPIIFKGRALHKGRDIRERAGGGARILVLDLKWLQFPQWHLAIWIVLVTFHSFETSVCVGRIWWELGMEEI